MDNLKGEVLKITQKIEEQVEHEIERLNNLDLNDYETLRQQRLQKLKKEQEIRMENIKQGHGQYEEIPEEKKFFDIIKKSSKVVCHFYTPTSERSKIMDMHLKKLAPSHIETKFCHINAEKSPFLAERLKIKIIPTVVLIKDQVMVNRLIGFSSLGNRDDFSTDMLEWTLGQQGVINYEGDLSQPPQVVTNKSKSKRRNVREDEDSDSDDEYVFYDAPNQMQDNLIGSNLRLI